MEVAIGRTNSGGNAPVTPVATNRFSVPTDSARLLSLRASTVPSIETNSTTLSNAAEVSSTSIVNSVPPAAVI